MRFFLYLKNWQVFLLTFGLFPLGFIFFSSLDKLIFDENPYWNGFDALVLALLILQTLCMVLTNCWFYAIGTYLHKKYYYNSFVLVVSRIGIYATIILSTLAFGVLPLMGIREFALISLAFLTSLVTLIYCSSFSARLLKMAELRRDVAFGEFLSEFFGFLFYPVGVWWLQPRINKIIDNERTGYDPDAPLDQHIKI